MAEEVEYAMARTSIWWDIENCQVPKGCDAYGITQNIKSALRNMNYCGPLSISSYGNINLIPKHVQQALSSTGISLNHVPSGRKDASDKRILVDMFLWVLENPAPANIMLISGDCDFSDALHRLGMRRYNILLAHPRQVSVSLVSSAKTTWLWRSLLSGGGPLTLYRSSWLVSEISSQDSSEQVLPRESMDLGAGSTRTSGICVTKELNQPLQQETRRKKLKKKCYKIGSAWFCHVACKSFELITGDLSGREHIPQWDLKQNCEFLGVPQNMATISSDYHPENATTFKKQAEVLVDAKNIEETVEDNELQSWDVEEYMKCLGKQNMEPIKTIESEVGAPLNVELSRDFGVTKEVKECFDAVLEKLRSSNNEIVTEKLESIEMRSVEPESASKGPSGHLERDMNKKGKNRKKKERRKESIAECKLNAEHVCRLCNVMCPSQTAFDSHLSGQKHVAMLSQSEALNNSRKLEKEISEEKAQPREIVAEIQLRSEITQEKTQFFEKNEEFRESSIIQLCSSTKDRVETVNKQLLRGDSFFGDLRYDSEIPREARESFDGIVKPVNLSEGAVEHLEEVKASVSEAINDPQSSVLTKPIKEPEVLEPVWCQVCEIFCISKDAYENHTCGKRHREKFDLQSVLARISKEDAETSKVVFQNQTLFDSPLKSLNHPAMAKGHAEVLVESRKIQQESYKEIEKSKEQALDKIQRVFIELKRESLVINESKHPLDVNLTDKWEDDSKHPKPMEPEKKCVGSKENPEGSKVQADNLWTRLWGKKI